MTLRLIIALGLALVPSATTAQVTRADYDRAQALSSTFEALAVNVPDTPTWIGTTHRFYYRRLRPDGYEFVTVDADIRQKQPSFDHARLADVRRDGLAGVGREPREQLDAGGQGRLPRAGCHTTPCSRSAATCSGV